MASENILDSSANTRFARVGVLPEIERWHGFDVSPAHCIDSQPAETWHDVLSDHG
jgi:hypothetical protein